MEKKIRMKRKNLILFPKMSIKGKVLVFTKKKHLYRPED